MIRKPATRKTKPGRQVSEIYSWAAPVKGWYDSESLADMPDGSAFVLDNWFPESTSLKIRPGYVQYARLLAAGETTSAAYTFTPNVSRMYSRLWPNARHAQHTYLMASSGPATRRGSGSVFGGDNGDADGV